MKTYDVVVVGGGINGVGVAQAAAAAGHSVLLIEKQGLASGTSSRSSKLIHGGLRYLESWELSLVRESLRERALLLKLAPDIVRLEPFYIPVYRHTRRGAWLIHTGLSLYAVLGGLDKAARFERVPRNRWDALDGLTTNQLDAVFQYSDGQTDDALLTRAVMNSAIQLGAELAMPAQVSAVTLTKDGCNINYTDTSDDKTCAARVLVNATGPWANDVLQHVQPAQPKRRVELVQGTHIELAGKVENGIYYVEAPRDGRAIFVMPWKGRTLVGTTEVGYKGNPDKVQPLKTELRYLCSVVNHYFPRYDADPNAVEDAFAGLRVLPAGSGHAFHRTRETMLDSDRCKHPRLLTIFGGKLTSYRVTAQKVMRRIAASLPERRATAQTSELRLHHP